jgi:hypothetical protein
MAWEGWRLFLEAGKIIQRNGEEWDVLVLCGRKL